MNKIRNIIQEIGEASSKPFEYHIKQGRKQIKIRGANDPETKTEQWSYSIDAYTEDKSGKRLPIEITLQFYRFDHITKPEGTVILLFEFFREGISFPNYGRVNSRVYMFRIMSTVMNIIRKEIKSDDEIGILAYYPVDDDRKNKVAVLLDTSNQRDRLYSAYIRKMFPNATREDRPNGLVYWKLR